MEREALEKEAAQIRDGGKPLEFPERDIHTPVGVNSNPLGKARVPIGQLKTQQSLDKSSDKQSSQTRLNTTKTGPSIKEVQKMKPMMRRADGSRTA